MNLGRALSAVLLLTLAGAGSLRADLSKAKAEKSPERRARLALDNAKTQFRVASATYKGGDLRGAMTLLEEVRDSVQLAYESLKETGKKPRGSNDYKNLEIKTRELLRNLEDLRQRMAVDDREYIVPVMTYIQQVHDEVLNSVMGNPKQVKVK